MPYLYRLNKNGEIEEIQMSEVHHRGYKNYTEDELAKIKEYRKKYRVGVKYYGRDKTGKEVNYSVPGYPDYYVRKGTNARTVFSMEPNFERAREDLDKVVAENAKKLYDEYMKKMKRMCRMLP